MTGTENTRLLENPTIVQQALSPDGLFVNQGRIFIREKLIHSKDNRPV